MNFPQLLNDRKDEIMSFIEGPMFFLYDDQLVNLYEHLSRLSDSDLQEFCRDTNISKMCDIVTSERRTDFGQLSGFANERGMLNIEGLLPILSSFPSFDDAMNFIMRIKPGFRYSRQFKDFVEQNTLVRVNGPETEYILGNYKYSKFIDTNTNQIIIHYYKLVNNQWLLHRINGPAHIRLYTEIFGTQDTIEIALFEADYYRNDVLENAESPNLHYYRESTGDVDRDIDTQLWYKNGVLSRENGPAKIRTFLRQCPTGHLRIDGVCYELTRRQIERELEKRSSGKHYQIVSGEGDTVISEYYKNGKPIKV